MTPSTDIFSRVKFTLVEWCALIKNSIPKKTIMNANPFIEKPSLVQLLFRFIELIEPIIVGVAALIGPKYRAHHIP